jgi:hypothetical protein
MGPVLEQLRLTLWITAAIGDATPEQFSRLRERLQGELARHRLVDNTSGIRRAVLEVMGASWEPRGEHRAQLELLGWAP